MYSDYVPAGKVTTTHGLKGAVKVYPMLDDPGRFSRFKSVVLEKGNRRVERKVMSVQHAGRMVVLKLEGTDSIEEAAALRDSTIYVTRKEAADLKEGQYFRQDLIGLKVQDEEGQEIGMLSDIIRTGANDVYSVALPDGRELLLPAIRSCILEISLEEGYMKVHVLEGLMPG